MLHCVSISVICSLYSAFERLFYVWKERYINLVNNDNNNYKKECTRIAAASDKVYQLLAHDRWFAPGTPASSTTKRGRHHIAGILLKVALIHQQSLSQAPFQDEA